MPKSRSLKDLIGKEEPQENVQFSGESSPPVQAALDIKIPALGDGEIARDTVKGAVEGFKDPNSTTAQGALKGFKKSKKVKEILDLFK